MGDVHVDDEELLWWAQSLDPRRPLSEDEQLVLRAISRQPVEVQAELRAVLYLDREGAAA